MRLSSNVLAFLERCFGCSEKGWRVKTFENFRCWNEINYE